MASARSLLRTHLDTALRFSAAWLVENPHEFATLAISGKPINKLKDREGKALMDSRLVEIRSRDWPWLPKVYGWLELIQCFREGTAMLIKFVNGYAVTKRLTREQLEDGRRRV